MNLTSADQVRLVANAMKIQSATRDHVSYTLSQFGRVYLKLDSDTLCPCTSDSENAYAGADINIYYDAIIGEGEVVTEQRSLFIPNYQETVEFVMSKLHEGYTLVRNPWIPWHNRIPLTAESFATEFIRQAVADRAKIIH